MPWNSTSPLGSVSVKANRVIGQQNTTYIEVTMGNSVVGTNTNTTRDHFWNVGTNEDGRHRFIQSPAFTVGGMAADPVIGTGMDSVEYTKTILGTVQGFFRNAQGIYQHIPALLTGTVVIPSANVYSNIVAVPANCYGEIFMYTTIQGELSAQLGFFRAGAALVEAWSTPETTQSNGDAAIALKFGNGSQASGLNIRARRAQSSNINWNYIITYRAL